MVGVRELFDQVRHDRAKERESVKEPFLVPGGRAWRKREKEKKKARDKEYEKEHGRSLAQARYYRKNKTKLNAARIVRGRRPREVYKRTKARAERRGQEWYFDFDTWFELWSNAPEVLDRRSGFYKSAWECKGGNFTKDTQMYRKDITKGWSKSNCFIGIDGEELE